eukprot:6131244-Prymnesium_polylepis.3
MGANCQWTASRCREEAAVLVAEHLHAAAGLPLGVKHAMLHERTERTVGDRNCDARATTFGPQHKLAGGGVVQDGRARYVACAVHGAAAIPVAKVATRVE